MSAFNEVVEVLGQYFDGLHHSDTAILRRVFHPQAHYYCATDGTLLHLGMDEYFPIVDKRRWQIVAKVFHYELKRLSLRA